MSSNDVDLLDRPVLDAFERAHADARWAGNAWTDPLPRLRAGARASRRRSAAAAGLAVVAAAGVGVAGAKVLGPGVDRLRSAPIASPGSGTGLDWLLTPAQYDAYTAAHPSPSDNPRRVPSPVPVDAEAQRLQADVNAAVGDETTLRLDAADGGEQGHAVMWLRVGGTPVAVERYQLAYPLVAGDTAQPTAAPGATGDSAETFTSPRTWSDGTAYTVASGHAMGYAFSKDEQWSGPVVWTVTTDGWLTSWTAPVAADQLLSWAQTADEHYTAGG